MKVCIDCNIEKEYNDYYKRKDNKDGYRNNCKACQNIKNKPGTEKYRKKDSSLKASKEYNKKYWLENADELKEKGKERYYENQEAYLLQKKEYFKLNKDKIRLKGKKYYINNKSDIINKNIEYNRRRKTIDPLYNFKCRIRTTISKTLMGYKKSHRTEEILGISILEFFNYIESLFEPWMTWENRGLYNGELNYGWDIDHKIPLASAETEEDIIRLNHYTNLQPLCGYTNRYIKGDRLDYEKTQ